jgi:hypothetical protein
MMVHVTARRIDRDRMRAMSATMAANSREPAQFPE